MLLDPTYLSVPARYIAEVTSAITHHHVAVEHALTRAPLAIDHDHEIIRVKSGMSLPQFQWVLARATLRILFGEEWAPEFKSRNGHGHANPRPPRLSLVPRQRSEPGPTHTCVDCEACRAEVTTPIHLRR